MLKIVMLWGILEGCSRILELSTFLGITHNPNEPRGLILGVGVKENKGKRNTEE